MFKKPFKVKSNSQLKGSDRKKLRGDILLQFPNLSEENLNAILPNKETIFQLKILCHSGDVVVVYSVQKLPIIFETEKVMFPTVYMLWHVPDLLHTFTTHPQVFPIIAGGADLMLPGVVLCEKEGPHAYGRLERGDRVAVNLTTNRAPIAVGRAAHSSYDMYMAARRGKCVQVLHYYGDLLSTYGTKLMVPELGCAFPEDLEVNEETVGAQNDIESDLAEGLVLDLKEMNVGSDDTGDLRVPDAGSNAGQVAENTEEHISDSPSTAESMDELLKYCFLKSLRTTMKKVDLPVLTSNFYKLHMIPACPKTKSLDIKKSSYKKLSNFLDEMVKLNVISVETLQKGVQSISRVDYSNELVQRFVDDFSNEYDESGLVVDVTKTNKSAVPEITEKYTVTAAVLPLFYAYDYKKKEAVTPAVVRKVIGDYVKVKNLQNPTNKKEVVLDEILYSATGAPSDTAVMPWDQLVSAVFARMGHAFKVELSGTELPLTKGKLQPIDIQVGTRSGNKKVTLVNNLELYGIDVGDFARECQLGVAASTTIHNSAVPGRGGPQLQIQGNQVIYLGKVLTEKYQIPKRYLRGLENAPKKKK